MKRRDFISIFVKGTGAVIAAVMAIPVVIHSLTPNFTKDEHDEWKPLGPVKSYPRGKITTALVKVTDDAGSLNSKSVFVWRRAEEDFVVYSRSCTDLGCPLNYDSGSEWFFCPCHGGIFDKEGERRAGPPNKPMWRFKNRIRDGILEIDIRSVPAMV